MDVDCVDCPSTPKSIKENGSICSSLGSDKSKLEENFDDLIMDPMKIKIEIPKIPKDKEMPVIISWVNDPSNFYVTPYSGCQDFIYEVQKEQRILIEKGKFYFLILVVRISDN